VDFWQEDAHDWNENQGKDKGLNQLVLFFYQWKYERKHQVD
jgi:hypothetical protein